MDTPNKETTSSGKETDSKKTGKKIHKINATQVLLGIFLVALIIVGVLVWNLLNKKEDAPVASGGSLVVDESNLDAIKSELQEKVDKGRFEINMNMDWTFPNGTTASSDAYVANAKTNGRPVNIEVSLADTGELIYESSVIPIDKKLDNITLSKDLEAGTYSAICKYNMLDEEHVKTGENLSVAVTIIVQN